MLCVRWEEWLSGVFDDLEQQAEGLLLGERDAEVAERSRAEYAAVDLASRLHASAGHAVTLDVAGVGRVAGTLGRLGADWCLVGDGRGEWAVRFAAVVAARGVAGRAVSEQARPVTARLALRSLLRQVAEDREPVVVHRLDGRSARVVMGRVGADFVEVSGVEVSGVEASGQGGAVDLLAVGHLAALHRG